VQFTSFGPTGIVLTDHLVKLGLMNLTRVVMIDTLHLFPETYELVHRAYSFFGLEQRGKIFRYLRGLLLPIRIT
jgi:3'-phosphoadenosine 5'-phosphosulfate sulfotransferase (PAPS reductase)/FAD synthetase